MDINYIKNLIMHDMSLVNRKILKQIHSKINLINTLGEYIINSGGKRIRPVMTVLAAKALNYTGNKHITIAAFIECIHTATLLHDDIIDGSKLRRGKTTINVSFGNASSLLLGDFIYTQAFRMMLSLNSMHILNLISRAVNIIVKGEILQLANVNNLNFDIKTYMNIIYSKTACLFEVALQTPAILSGACKAQEHALLKYGKYFGIAFQLNNDLSDYLIDNESSFVNKFNDLKNGKLTMPLIHALKHSNYKQFKSIQEAIKLSDKKELLQIVLEMIKKSNSIEYTRNYIVSKVNKAISFLRFLSPSSYRDALEELALLLLKNN